MTPRSEGDGGRPPSAAEVGLEVGHRPPLPPALEAPPGDPLAETKALSDRAPAPEEGVPAAPRRAPAPRKPAATKQGTAKQPAKRRTVRRSGARKPDLREDLRAFAAGRPEGWSHDDWLAFVNHLRERGHDVSDPDAVGRSLERERLAAVLEAVPGLGPRRIEALVSRFDTLWSLRQAHVDDIARVPGIPRALAERVAVSLHDRT
ncbi:MAG TPA: helix-hairpin-helix domain-containing protein [Longimicrobiaceae bacterium]|nr:helix-hairpin-helix domain-containing protein [Longimicrobiaceae bacterium]